MRKPIIRTAVLTAILMAGLAGALAVDHYRGANKTGTDIRGLLAPIGNMQSKEVVRVTFPGATVRETLVHNKVYVIKVPDDPAVPLLSLDQVVMLGGDATQPVNYFGYKYTSADGANEVAHRDDPSFQVRFPGQFFASARARVEDALYDNVISQFEQTYGITMAPTNAGGVGLERNSRYIVVVNGNQPVNFNIRNPAVCGNGTKEGTEQCDDSNTTPGDGCSATCTVESGWTCSGTNPSTCTTTCGDGIKAGTEACDDHNNTPDDGCSVTCTVESGWTCTDTSPSICSAICGDGVQAGTEACDDHNLNNNDGCSNTCTIESGWNCTGTPSVCTPIPAVADLSLSMSADPGTVDQGGTMAITANFHNAGSGDAHNVSFSGSLLNERRFSRLLVFESAAGATCSEQSFAAVCDLGDIASGGNKEVVLTMKTVTGATCVADQLQAFTGAVVAGSPSDPQLSNNKVAAMYTVNCPNVLWVSSAHLTPAKVESGGYVPLALLAAQVKNVSHSAVNNTVVTVPVSDSLSFKSASGGLACSVAVGQISCDVGTLQAGETKSIGLLFDVNILTDPHCDYDTPTTITTSLSALSDTPDPMPWDNQNYSVSMTTLCPSDVGIVSADFDPKDLSQAMLTVVVKNNGPGIAVRTVTMPLSSNVIPLYQYNQPCGTSYGNLSCPTGWLLPGQTRTFKVPFRFADSATCVAGRKTLSFDTHDTNQSNDSYPVTIKPWNHCTVGDGVDLDLALQTPLLGANQQVIFPMEVWNIGRVSDSYVLLTHTLASDETYISASGTSCVIDGDQLYCELGSIAYNDHKSFSITLQYPEPQPCGQVNNRFTTFDVLSGSSDVNTGNNRGTAFFESACPADWEMISAQFSPAAVPPSTDTTLSVRVQNSGPTIDNALFKVTGTENGFYDHNLPPLCFGFPDTDTTEWGARVFTCWVGNLASGETKDLSLGFQAHGDPQHMCTTDYSPVVTTSVYGHGYDSNPSNASLRPAVMWDCPGTGALCGDGIKEGTEQCDDHNTNPNDGCSAVCQIETGWTCNNSSPSICSPVCGDGSKKGSEQCDDGNLAPGDGCTGICTAETGWICTGSNPSTCIATCGDGLKVGPEGCDDDNLNPNDGCSPTCTVETGWSCDASQPSVCTQIVCGDGIKTGAEACDDHNTTPGDGCSATCTVESGWTCTGTNPSTCTTTCGDGLKSETEACDDHNTTSGDGCSATCAIESGWVCTGVQPSICTKCGNGVIDSDRGEECDYADPNEPAGECNQSCRFTIPIPEF